jgi:hypothetical protein
MDGERAERQVSQSDEGTADAQAAEPRTRLLTAAEIAVQALASHEPLLNSATELTRIQAHAQSFASSLPIDKLGVLDSVPTGLTADKLARSFLTNEVAQQALHTSGIASEIVASQKFGLAGLGLDLPATKMALTGITGGLGGGLSTKLIERWRETLALGQRPAQLEVAGAMSRIIADTNLGALVGPQLLGSLTGELLSKRIAEGTASYLIEIGRELREGLIASIKPAALMASSALMERIRASNKKEQKYEAALWQMGWWMPPSASMDFFWEVGALADEGRRHDLRRAMTEAARSREFGRIVEQWMQLDPFGKRRRFLRDALQDHRRGRYRVSIPILLMLLEGIAIDAFMPRSTDTHPRRAIKTAAETFDSVMGSAMVETVTILWARNDFSVASPTSRTLNRQLILHGRSTGYATEANSAKVLFALDLLASLVEDAMQHPERALTS